MPCVCGGARPVSLFSPGVVSEHGREPLSLYIVTLDALGAAAAGPLALHNNARSARSKRRRPLYVGERASRRPVRGPRRRRPVVTLQRKIKELCAS